MWVGFLLNDLFQSYDIWFSSRLHGCYQCVLESLISYAHLGSSPSYSLQLLPPLPLSTTSLVWYHL